MNTWPTNTELIMVTINLTHDHTWFKNCRWGWVSRNHWVHEAYCSLQHIQHIPWGKVISMESWEWIILITGYFATHENGQEGEACKDHQEVQIVGKQPEIVWCRNKWRTDRLVTDWKINE